MEFDEMKKIWDAQNNQMLFAIDEEALHSRIASKKTRSTHTTNLTEWIVIVVNLAAGAFVISSQDDFNTANIIMYGLGVWMGLTAIFVITRRIQRLRGEAQFDRTMLGDLNHAIAQATYQVRLSYLMRWNMLPIAGLLLLGLWQNGSPLWTIIMVLTVSTLAFFAGGWEHGVYERWKRELEVLRKKLTDDQQVG